MSGGLTWLLPVGFELTPLLLSAWFHWLPQMVLCVERLLRVLSAGFDWLPQMVTEPQI